MKKDQLKVLVVSPHPDDETLGAGGTLLKYKSLGYKVYWLNISNMKEEYGFEKNRIQKRLDEIESVKKSYQFDGYYDLGLKPAGLDTYPMGDIVQKIADIFGEVQPNIVILPFKNDIHSDHRVVFDAVYSCTKSFRYPYVKKVLMMEIPSETYDTDGKNNFTANYLIDVSSFLDKKIEIMKTYESEMAKHPFPRSEENLKALATMRGSEAGCQYAEGFMLLKEIWD